MINVRVNVIAVALCPRRKRAGRQGLHYCQAVADYFLDSRSSTLGGRPEASSHDAGANSGAMFHRCVGRPEVTRASHSFGRVRLGWRASTRASSSLSDSSTIPFSTQQRRQIVRKALTVA